jgi:hypothetical protein
MIDTYIIYIFNRLADKQMSLLDRQIHIIEELRIAGLISTATQYNSKSPTVAFGYCIC